MSVKRHSSVEAKVRDEESETRQSLAGEIKDKSMEEQKGRGDFRRLFKFTVLLLHQIRNRIY